MTLSRKEMVKKAALDVLKAFIIGVAVAAATAVILFACGFLFGSFQIVNGFEVVKDGLLQECFLQKEKKKMQMRKKKQRMDGDSILA